MCVCVCVCVCVCWEALSMSQPRNNQGRLARGGKAGGRDDKYLDSFHIRTFVIQKEPCFETDRCTSSRFSCTMYTYMYMYMHREYTTCTMYIVVPSLG